MIHDLTSNNNFNFMQYSINNSKLPILNSPDNNHEEKSDHEVIPSGVFEWIREGEGRSQERRW